MLIESATEGLTASLPDIHDRPVLEEHVDSSLIPDVNGQPPRLLGPLKSALVACSPPAPLNLMRVPPFAVGRN